MNKKLKYLSEYCALRIIFALFTILPFRAVSEFSYILGTFLASLPLPTNTVARANIRKAMPELDEKSVQNIHEKSTQNIIATFLELPKCYALNKASFEKRVTLKGVDILQKHKGCLVLTAHYGNWEIPLRMSTLYGIKMGNVYRKANNSFVNSYIERLRQQPAGQQFSKGKSGTRALLKAMNDPELSIGFLNDQKLNDGISAPFFGHMVMTPTALAGLALKFNRPVCPMFCMRNFDGTFTLEIKEPIDLNGKTTEEATAFFNKILETEIKSHPEQWMWAHKRFG